jgi:hypothetical protein
MKERHEVRHQGIREGKRQIQEININKNGMKDRKGEGMK